MGSSTLLCHPLFIWQVPGCCSTLAALCSPRGRRSPRKGQGLAALRGNARQCVDGPCVDGQRVDRPWSWRREPAVCRRPCPDFEFPSAL